MRKRVLSDICRGGLVQLADEVVFEDLEKLDLDDFQLAERNEDGTRIVRRHLVDVVGFPHHLEGVPLLEHLLLLLRLRALGRGVLLDGGVLGSLGIGFILGDRFRRGSCLPVLEFLLLLDVRLEHELRGDIRIAQVDVLGGRLLRYRLHAPDDLALDRVEQVVVDVVHLRAVEQLVRDRLHASLADQSHEAQRQSIEHLQVGRQRSLVHLEDQVDALRK